MHNCLWWRCLQQTSNPQKIRPRYCLDLPLHLHPDLPFCIGLDLNRSGHSFRACVALRLTQLVFYRGFVLLDRENEVDFLLLKLGLCMGDPC